MAMYDLDALNVAGWMGVGTAANTGGGAGPTGTNQMGGASMVGVLDYFSPFILVLSFQMNRPLSVQPLMTNMDGSFQPLSPSCFSLTADFHPGDFFGTRGAGTGGAHQGTGPGEGPNGTQNGRTHHPSTPDTELR